MGPSAHGAGKKDLRSSSNEERLYSPFNEDESSLQPTWPTVTLAFKAAGPTGHTGPYFLQVQGHGPVSETWPQALLALHLPVFKALTH